MLSFHYAVAFTLALLFAGASLLKATLYREPSATLATTFDDQFGLLGKLTFSLTRSIPRIKKIRTHSMAFEDLSYALTGSSNDDLSRDVRLLSLDIDAFATLLQRYYVEVDVLVHLTTATSYMFGKLLEHQPTSRFLQQFCRPSRIRTPARCQALYRLSLALRNHIDTLSEALACIDSLTLHVLLARQRVQHRVEVVVATIVRSTDIPAGNDCDLFLALWKLFDRDGEGFSASARNSAAFRAFCTHLMDLGHQLDQDMAIVRTLRDVLATFRSAQTTGFHPDIRPSSSTRLIELAEATLQLRVAGRQGGIHDQQHHASIEPQ